MPVSTRQEEKAPSFEEVWALIKEVGEKQKETAVQMQETDRRMQETDRRMQETDCKFKEIERVVDKLCGKVGNIDTNIGYAAESYFYTALAKSLMFGNIRFDEVIPNLKKERKGASCEFDLVLLNHEAVAIIEVKHRIHPSLPEEMATRKAAQFRRFFPEYKNYTLYLGVAGLSMDDAVVEHARDFGVGVLKQDGDAIESFDVPLKAY
jgi:hypothetical protein